MGPCVSLLVEHGYQHVPAMTRHFFMDNASDDMCCCSAEKLLRHLCLKDVTTPLEQHVLCCSCTEIVIITVASLACSTNAKHSQHAGIWGQCSPGGQHVMHSHVWHAVGDFMELKAWMDREWPVCPRALRNALLPLSAVDQLKLSPALPKDERMRRWRSPDGQELLFTAEQAVVSAQSLTGKNGASAYAVKKASALCALCAAVITLQQAMPSSDLCSQLCRGRYAFNACSMHLNYIDKLPHACLMSRLDLVCNALQLWQNR